MNIDFISDENEVLNIFSIKSDKDELTKLKQKDKGWNCRCEFCKACMILVDVPKLFLEGHEE